MGPGRICRAPDPWLGSAGLPELTWSNLPPSSGDWVGVLGAASGACRERRLQLGIQPLPLPAPSHQASPSRSGRSRKGGAGMSVPTPPLLRHSPQAPAPLCPRTNVLGVVGSLGLDAEGWDPVPPAHHWLPASCLLLHPGQLSPELQSVSAREGQTWADDLLGQVRAPRSGERGPCPLGGCGLAAGLCGPRPVLSLPPVRRLRSGGSPVRWSLPAGRVPRSRAGSPKARAHLPAPLS